MKYRSRGFTLIEVVIALTLISLIMLGLVAALSTFGRSSSRLEQLSQQMDEVRLVSGFLRQILSGASAKHPHMLDDGRQLPYFIGSATELEWLAPMPARHGVGGLHRLRLSVREEPGGMDLVLKFIPFVPLDPFAPAALPDWTQVQGRILARGVDRFSIAYRGLGEEAWHVQWSESTVLPGWVAVRVSAGEREWPVLIVGLDDAQYDVALSDGKSGE